MEQKVGENPSFQGEEGNDQGNRKASLVPNATSPRQPWGARPPPQAPRGAPAAFVPARGPPAGSEGQVYEPRATNLPGAEPPLPRGGRRGAGGRGTRVPSHVAAAAGQTMGARAAFLLLLLLTLGFVSSRAGPSRGAGWVESKTKRKQRHKKAPGRPLASQRLAGGWRWWRRGAKGALLPGPGGTHAPATPKRAPSIPSPNPAGLPLAKQNPKPRSISGSFLSSPSRPHFLVEIPGGFEPEKTLHLHTIC